MKKVILGIIFCFAFGIGKCQSKLGNEWITGLGGPRIVFSNGNVTTNKDHLINSYFHVGNSDICDTNGNLILASDGFNIYDSLGNYIDDGDTIVPQVLYLHYNGWSVYSQSSIFLPMDSDKYYFITPTFSDTQFADCLSNNHCYFDLLLYNVIDMKANGGAGKVVKRMIPLMEHASLRKTQMMACRHANGKDWWLLKQEGDNANVHTFLFTQDSVYDKGIQVFNTPSWGGWDIRGQSTFNGNGTQYATTSHGLGSGLIMLADFDRCYGKLTNPKILQMPRNSLHDPADTTQTESLSVGLTFSPNNQFLYVASICNLYQYDLQDSTWFHVAGIDTSFLHFQKYETTYLGPDNKIYIGNFGGQSKQMSRIDNPDVKGTGCNFCPRCLRMDSLSGVFSLGTPPCMPNYSLGAKACWPDATNDISKELNELLVYPNPASSSLAIDITNKKDKKLHNLELYNVVGELILKTEIENKTQIDISSIPKGVYILRSEGVSKKVVVGVMGLFVVCCLNPRIKYIGSCLNPR